MSEKSFPAYLHDQLTRQIDRDVEDDSSEMTELLVKLSDLSDKVESVKRQIMKNREKRLHQG
ncbi:hypothetical protein [Aestuariibacter salexigens]|uniref:hypothetical protein n=1 Tax=Aestuariibacter salexigens TaxID=226010 RepID=UPI0003FA1C63|nr:hypothetical protein [Aestuariibacter salexigens]